MRPASIFLLRTGRRLSSRGLAHIRRCDHSVSVPPDSPPRRMTSWQLHKLPVSIGEIAAKDYPLSYCSNLSSSPRFPTSSIKTGIRTLLNHSETLRIDSLPILEQTKPLKRYLYFPPWTSSVMSRLARTALAFVLWFIDVNPGIDKRVFYGACCIKQPRPRQLTFLLTGLQRFPQLCHQSLIRLM